MVYFTRSCNPFFGFLHLVLNRVKFSLSLNCRYAAENAALFREENGYKLLSCLVGDSLLEVISVQLICRLMTLLTFQKYVFQPFWPMGTGCARGFLAGFDTVWATRQWSLKNMDFSNAGTFVTCIFKS